MFRKGIMLKDIQSDSYGVLTVYRKDSYQKIATWLSQPCIVEGYGVYTYLKEGEDFEYCGKTRYNNINTKIKK